MSDFESGATEQQQPPQAAAATTTHIVPAAEAAPPTTATNSLATSAPCIEPTTDANTWEYIIGFPYSASDQVKMQRAVEDAATMEAAVALTPSIRQLLSVRPVDGGWGSALDPAARAGGLVGADEQGGCQNHCGCSARLVSKCRLELLIPALM
jgi:hypothetical protein